MSEDITNLDRIVKVIMRPCPQMIVKHCVKLIRRNNRDKSKTYGFIYEYNLPNLGNTKGLQLNTEDSIVIEAVRYDDDQTTKQNGGVYKPPPQVFISYMESPLTIISIDIALRWLQGDENKDIFISDVNGSPIRLGKTVSTIVPMNYNHILMFQPAIIYDDDKTAYQGIKIKCESGDIADLTAQEFLEFALSLKYILMNLYSNSNILTLMGMMYWLNK